MRQSLRLAIAALVLSALAPSGAAAGDMTFMMKNSHPESVVIELTSRGRDQVWPGNGQVYQLNSAERKTVPVACVEGEEICYGAWVFGDDTQSFGIGPDKDVACTNCCFICVDGTKATISLHR